jgi:hypothetical protein
MKPIIGLIALLSFALMLPACSEDDAPAAGGGTPPVGGAITGAIRLPANSPLDPSSIEVLSPSSSGTVNPDGSYSVPSPTLGNPTVVVAVGSQGTPILVATSPPGTQATLEISATSTAQSLVMMSPLCILTSGAQRTAVLGAATQNAQFASLVQNIESLLATDPQNTLSYALHPRIYEQANEITADILKSAAYYGLLKPSDALLESPTIEDASGDSIAFVNSAPVYFGAEIWKPGDTTPSDIPLIDTDPTGITFTVGYPPTYQVQSTKTNYNLGDGSFEIRMTRGFDPGQSADQFFNTAHATGKASLANMALFCYLTTDLVTGYVPTTEVNPLSLVLNSSKTSPFLPRLNQDLSKGDALAVLTSLTSIMLANSDEVTNWLFGDDATATTLRYTAQLYAILNNGASITKILGTGDQAADQLIPFVYNITSGERWVTQSVSQQGGTIGGSVANISPFRPSVSSDVSNANVGARVSFSTVTQDEEGDSISYRFHWGDGTSTGWSAFVPSGQSVASTHAFSQQGVYNVVAEAQDVKGGVSERSQPFAIQISPTGATFWYDFDSDVPGLFPADPPWNSDQVAPSYLRVVNDVFSGQSGNSCGFFDYDPDLAESEGVYAVITTQIQSGQQGTMEFAWRVADINDNFGVRAWQQMPVWDGLGYYVLFTAGKISYYSVSEGGIVPIQDIQAGRWYTMKLDYDISTKKFDITIDGVLMKSGAGFYATSQTSLNTLQIVAFSDAQCRAAYVDNFKLSGASLAKVPAGAQPRVPEAALRMHR